MLPPETGPRILHRRASPRATEEREQARSTFGNQSLETRGQAVAGERA